jgi:MFS superfamily sulfate permease-like transporter
MAVSFPSSTVHFFQNYGSHILPVTKELVDVFVFKRTISSDKALFVGFVACMGVTCFFDKKISVAIGLTGAIVFLIYKVSTHFATQKQDLDASMQAADRKWLELQKKFTYDSNEALDFANPAFDTQFKALTEKLISQTELIRAQWKNPDILDETRNILNHCQNILFQVRTILKRQTADLELDREARLQKMAELLNDHDMENKVFHRAFSLLNEIYRMARCKGYVISLQNISHYPDRNFSSIVTDVDVPKEYFELFNNFFTRIGPQRDLNKIFNDTQSKLAGLLKLVYPGSPLNAKDNCAIPGDHGNPNNPFRIRT